MGNLYLSDYLLYLISIAVISVVFVVLFFVRKIGIAERFLKNYPLSKIYFSTIAFTTLGLTLGVIIGISKSPAADVFISGFLSFLSGIAIYLFSGRENEERNLNISYILYITVILSISSYTGIISGSRQRNIHEDETRTLNQLEILEQKEVEYLLKIYHEMCIQDTSLNLSNIKNYYEIIDEYKQRRSITFDEYKRTNH